MPPRRANTRNANARNSNTVPLVPDHRVSNAEFQNTIQPFAQSMNNKNNQQVDGDKLREISKVRGSCQQPPPELSQKFSQVLTHGRTYGPYVRFRFSVFESRLDWFPVSSSATSVVSPHSSRTSDMLI
uniref:Uncharacterized protein n=1 Tax=Solanum tuberosum TaxID=4113 RepID=M1DBT8_SOLTU